MSDRYITIDEAAALGGVSRVTIYKWIASGKLERYKPNWRPYVRESDVLAQKKLREVPHIIPGETE